MNIQDWVKLGLSLIGKGDQLTSIVTDALALFKKVQKELPDLTKILESATKGGAQVYSVEWLQKSLNQLLGTKLTVDGKYGQATQDAVKQFQAQHGLNPDSWAGALTQAAIIEALKKL